MIDIKSKFKKQKRKNFKGILIKKLISTFLVTTLVLCVMSIALFQVTLYFLDSNFYMEETYSQDAVSSVYDGMLKQGFAMDNPKDMEEYYTRLKMRFYSNDYMATALLDGDTLEPIWDGGETGIAVIKGKDNLDEKYLYYEMEGEVPDKYREIYMYVQNGYMFDEMGKDPVDEIVDIYIKDRKFALGKVKLTEYKKGKKVVTEYDFTPEDTTGYTHIQNDENVDIMVSMVSGNPKDSYLYKAMQEYIQSLKDGRYQFTAYKGLWDMETQSSSMVFLPDGSRIVICKMFSVNLLEVAWKQIIIEYIIIYIVVLAFAALFARTKYLKLKSAYDMEDYRITMTNTMAHDLKSPLMSISGYAENLKANINTDKKEYYADSILENVTYMNDIIANVLELSKVETGTLKLNKVELNVEELVVELADHYRDALNEKSLELKVDGTLKIKADKILIHQAMDNIIGNAIKYSKENTTIEVSLEKNKGKGLISVSNVSSQDIGKDAENLWKPFVKGDNSRSNKQGTGVGLAIVKNILELHGYRLKLSCEDGIFKVNIKT